MKFQQKRLAQQPKALLDHLLTKACLQVKVQVQQARSPEDLPQVLLEGSGPWE